MMEFAHEHVLKLMSLLIMIDGHPLDGHLSSDLGRGMCEPESNVFPLGEHHLLCSQCFLFRDEGGCPEPEPAEANMVAKY